MNLQFHRWLRAWSDSRALCAQTLSIGHGAWRIIRKRGYAQFQCTLQRTAPNPYQIRAMLHYERPFSSHFVFSDTACK